MIKKMIIIGLILLVISLIGCAKKEAPPVGEKPTATEDAVTDVGSDISDVGALDKDLDTTDLENIDKELEEINW